MAATILHLTTGVVYVRDFSGTLTGGSLTLTGDAKAAKFSAGNGSAATPSFTFTSNTALGFYRSSPDVLTFVNGSSTTGMEISDNAVTTLSGSYFGFSNHATTIPGSNADVRLYRDAPSVLALRNGTVQQQLRVYNTTDGTNKEFGLFGFSSNVLVIGSDIVGTGTARKVSFYSAGSARWAIGATTGHLLAEIDATFDIGTDGATRPRSIYTSSTIFSGGDVRTNDLFYWNAGSEIAQVSNGILQFRNNAGTGFTRLILGTNDASGVALKKSTTTVQIRTGSDSAYGGMDAGTYAVGGVAGASFGPGTPTSITVVNGIVTAIS